MIEQENNKPSKEGIKRLENKKTPKEGAFGKTSNFFLLHDKEINETNIHWLR